MNFTSILANYKTVFRLVIHFLLLIFSQHSTLAPTRHKCFFKYAIFVIDTIFQLVTKRAYLLCVAEK